MRTVRFNSSMEEINEDYPDDIQENNPSLVYDVDEALSSLEDYRTLLLKSQEDGGMSKLALEAIDIHYSKIASKYSNLNLNPHLQSLESFNEGKSHYTITVEAISEIDNIISLIKDQH